jgi:hypothetical protein
VDEVATDLSCDWHTIMDVVVHFGTPLIDDPNRFGEVDAVPRRDVVLQAGAVA